MKISKLIKELQDSLEMHGDLNVYVWDENEDEEYELKPAGCDAMYNDLNNESDLGDVYPEIPEGPFILIS